MVFEMPQNNEHRVQTPASDCTQVTTAERWYQDKRVGGLARFAVAITFLNIIGHLWLGFEQSWITPFVALAAAYITELLLEFVAAREERRPLRFLGEGTVGWVKFLLSAHVTGLAVGMLLMPLEQIWVVAFAASIAIASKHIIRVAINGKVRHVLNPSNFGITAALLLFPSVGIAPPYQFSEGTSGLMDWVLPFLVICTGSLLNTKFTGRMPLIGAWIFAFLIQGLIRSVLHDYSFVATLMPMTGFAFILFTFYMITDPATSPSKISNQIIFGIAVAAFYMMFIELHVVFGLFYALTLVTMIRALWFALNARPSLVWLYAQRLRTDLASPIWGEARRKTEPAE